MSTRVSKTASSTATRAWATIIVCGSSSAIRCRTSASCPYDPTYAVVSTPRSARLSASQSQACIDACRKLVPNGCDCFGCCQIPGAPNAIRLAATCTADEVQRSDRLPALHAGHPVREHLRALRDLHRQADAAAPIAARSSTTAAARPPAAAGLPGNVAGLRPGRHRSRGVPHRHRLHHRLLPEPDSVDVRRRRRRRRRSRHRRRTGCLLTRGARPGRFRAMRYLHTMLRVRDLDAALKFFGTLGLRETAPPAERGGALHAGLSRQRRRRRPGGDRADLQLGSEGALRHRALLRPPGVRGRRHLPVLRAHRGEGHRGAAAAARRAHGVRQVARRTLGRAAAARPGAREARAVGVARQPRRVVGAGDESRCEGRREDVEPTQHRFDDDTVFPNSHLPVLIVPRGRHHQGRGVRVSIGAKTNAWDASGGTREKSRSSGGALTRLRGGFRSTVQSATGTGKARAPTPLRRTVTNLITIALRGGGGGVAAAAIRRPALEPPR